MKAERKNIPWPDTKYVFHDIAVSAAPPKACEGLIRLMKSAVGAEMTTSSLRPFIDIIRTMAADINIKSPRSVPLDVATYSETRKNDDTRHGYIQVRRQRLYGYDNIIRLYYVQVTAAILVTPPTEPGRPVPYPPVPSREG